MHETLLESSWRALLYEEFEKPYFEALRTFLNQEYQTQKVYPEVQDIFRAFDLCHFDDVKVVILGQDPYHAIGQAHGLAFSVPKEIKIPPSLANIFREIQQEFGFPLPSHGDLSHWARQGVLLLNTTLTVRSGSPLSHANSGWEIFSDRVIEILQEKKSGIVYMLWGSFAHKKSSLIHSEHNLILQAPHPSPLSAYRGFLGCDHFKQANEYLKAVGKGEIEWG